MRMIRIRVPKLAGSPLKLQQTLLLPPKRESRRRGDMRGIESKLTLPYLPRYLS